MPLVQVCYPLCPELPYIHHDFRYLAKRATEYLIEHGHHRIALATFDNYCDPVEGLTSFEHHQGYLEAMGAAGLDASVFPYEACVNGHAADKAYAVAEKILHALPRQTAIVASGRPRHHAVNNLFLQHEVLVFDHVHMLEQVEQDGCGDVVGQVAHNP